MKRPHFIESIRKGLKSHRSLALLGPRQCGKTTLAKLYAKEFKKGPVHYFDLENPEDIARLSNPFLSLDRLNGLVIIDEIQRKTELFEVLRVLIDKESKKRQFILLGSASLQIMKSASESLAGRIGFIEITPFNSTEAKDLEKLWVRGGFPLSYLANTTTGSQDWRKSFIKTFLERDIPNLGIQIPAESLRRFWLMLCHYHGQIFNASELGRSLGISDHTAKKYLDILSGTYMIRQLQPWFENINKRQVKSPKIYFRDSGIFHTLLNIKNYHELHNHPKVGASWEGFALEEAIRILELDSSEVFFWSSHQEAEIDLLTLRAGHKIGIEIKYNEVPKITKSMSISTSDLKLKKVIIIYPGKNIIELAKNVIATPLQSLASVI